MRVIRRGDLVRGVARAWLVERARGAAALLLVAAAVLLLMAAARGLVARLVDMGVR